MSLVSDFLNDFSGFIQHALRFLVYTGFYMSIEGLGKQLLACINLERSL